MGSFIDLTGMVFGRLLVKSRAVNSKKDVKWLCLCVCGEEREILGNSLRCGLTKSCGCLNKEIPAPDRTTHGHTKGRLLTPEYYSWRSMWNRCTNPKESAYKNYGGRGITVSEEWKSFDQFFVDMGKRGEGLSLDRKNNDGMYEKDNCRWASRIEQNNNKSRVCK